MRRLISSVVSSIALVAAGALAGEVESFNNRIFDLQYFTRPYERAAVAGGAWEGLEGDSSSALRNPAGLADTEAPELLTFWTFNFMKGESLGLQTIIPPGPDNESAIKIYDKVLSRMSDAGAYQAFRLDAFPGVFSLGADYMWNDLSNNDTARIEQSGLHPGVAWGLPLGKSITLGYGLTYLDDLMQWAVTWPIFTPGMPMPENMNYVLRSRAESLRHRLGLRSRLGDTMRFGVEGELGHGATDNEWNGVDTGGDDDMRHTGLRVGLEYDLAPPLTLAAEIEWHETLVEYGWHSPTPQIAPSIAKWDTEVVRPMLGLKYTLTDACNLMCGYRYNDIQTADMCGREADDRYHTYSAGATMSAFEKRVDITWNIEYSDLAGDGELMNLLSAGIRF